MTEKDENEQGFALEDFKLNPISSAEPIKPHFLIDENDKDLLSLETTETLENADLKATIEEPAIEQDEPEDPIFKELSAPILPELTRENRARLQMQSPTRIHFYWSFKENPFKILKRIFGSQTSYQLVARLLNQTNNREEFFPIDSDGSAWFDVDADSRYQVEVGFYAVNRPFVRVLFSNTLQTPRKSPSPRQDYSEYFAVSANQFAKVLNVSGYSQDAYEVALAGDDIESADRATETAFAQIFTRTEDDFDALQSSEMRFVLLALASGYTLEALRAHISSSLFAFLQSRAAELSAEKALTALQENFGVGTDAFDEEIEDESIGAAVFGLSSVNFPRNLKRRARLPKFAPISSPNFSENFNTARNPFVLLPPSLPAPENIGLLHNAVDFCVRQMFGVELMPGGMWSDKGQNGEMKFKVIGATSVPVYGSTGIIARQAKTFSVYNDATSFSLATLGSLGIGGGGGILHGIYEYYNDRVKKREFTNRTYTASDADAHNPATPNGVMQLISNFRSVQIHETGNALSKITGKSETAGNWTDQNSGITYWFGTVPNVNNSQNVNSTDWDTGQAFELKVLLKYRQLMGIA